MRYRVIVGLDYSTKPTIIRRILAGEHDIPWEERGMKRAEPGAIVDDLPPQSVPAMLAKGQIEVIDGG